MDQIETYVALLGIIILVSLVFKKVPIPMPLILLMAGMGISFFNFFPDVTLKPELVLDVFLPLFVYRTTAESSWRDVRKNIRPIISLSIGHIIFITILTAIAVHFLIPELGWPLAFVLGAVISPSDDVAIVPIAEKIKMPTRIVTILKGEGMFNDAAALIIFRFSLVAVITHQFLVMEALSSFFIIIIGETLYGLILGYMMGELRLKIRDPMLQVLISIITPFLAYLPAERLGGCGVLATAVTGFAIGYRYLERIPVDARIIARSVWSSIEFILETVLFFLVGLNLSLILERISPIPLSNLANYSLVIISVVIIGRFIWVYGTMFLSKLLPLRFKRESYSWQGLFVISWAGMRGGVSLAAAVAVPVLPNLISGVNPRDLLIFLVFCVIVATLLIQGMTLPWILKVLKIKERGEKEHYDEHLHELSIRLKLTKVVLRWLRQYRDEMKGDPSLCDELKLHVQQYKIQKKQLIERIESHDQGKPHIEELELKNELLISMQVIELERAELLRLWQKNEISYAVRNKLLQKLDYLSKHFA